MSYHLVPNDLYTTMMSKSYLYDTGIAPVKAQYEKVIAIQSSIIIALIVLCGVLLVHYFYERSLKIYFKEVLNANFGWWDEMKRRRK